MVYQAVGTAAVSSIGEVIETVGDYDYPICRQVMVDKNESDRDYQGITLRINSLELSTDRCRIGSDNEDLPVLRGADCYRNMRSHCVDHRMR